MPQISQEKRPSWLDIVTLSAALVVLTFGLGEYGLYEPHEGHFAGVAREMVLRGDWITPTLNGAPYLNKPPLLYWLGAVSIQLFGLSEFAARLPLAVSGWLGVVVAWKWARELWGLGAGRVVALMLSVTMGWFIFTHQLLIDALLSTLILATLLPMAAGLGAQSAILGWAVWTTWPLLAGKRAAGVSFLLPGLCKSSRLPSKYQDL